MDQLFWQSFLLLVPPVVWQSGKKLGTHTSNFSVFLAPHHLLESNNKGCSELQEVVWARRSVWRMLSECSSPCRSPGMRVCRGLVFWAVWVRLCFRCLCDG